MATSNIFKTFFSDVAKNLLEKLPTAPNRFNKISVSNYKNLKLIDKFQFAPVTEETINDILKSLDITKSAGIDNIAAILGMELRSLHLL